ncbi:MAG: hypothetical protein LBE59_06650 [Nevskiaceae bacterium]|jgi:hypothetical protein|nr:hypothetical protein [Nevskiaceae bacterium]
MKLQEIPQDQDPAYEGAKRLCYAVDDQGWIVPAHSSGWEVEETAKKIAWQMIESDLARIREAVRAGRASVLEYFMTARMMNPRLLAKHMGIFTFRVRRHLQPRVFAKLDDAWIARYAACLDIPVERFQASRRSGNV